MSFGLESLFVDHNHPATRGQRVTRGLVVIVFCSGAVAALAWVTHDAQRHANWRGTPCRILDSGVDVSAEETEAPYALSVLYSYTAKGQLRAGSTYRSRGYRSSDAEEVYALARSLPRGRTTTCYVNPGDPSQAVLELPSVAMWAGITAAAVLVSLALLIFYAIPQITQPPPRVPLPRRGEWVYLGFLVIACAAGAVWACVLPLWRNTQGAVWMRVPATVEHARLIAHEQHGEVPITIYHTDLLYRYTVAGVEYHSNQYRLTEISSPFARGRRERVAQLAATPELFCYVDPQQPQSAVLSRALSPTQLFNLWVIGVGLLGMYALIPRARRAWLDAVLRGSRWTIGGLLIMLLIVTTLGMIVMP